MNTVPMFIIAISKTAHIACFKISIVTLDVKTISPFWKLTTGLIANYFPSLKNATCSMTFKFKVNQDDKVCPQNRTASMAHMLGQVTFSFP